MKIVRNNQDIELTLAELRDAHAEYQRHIILSEIHNELEDTFVRNCCDFGAIDAFCHEIGLTDCELVSEIEDEYQIHCDNYSVFGLETPSVDSIVESVLDSYGFNNWLERYYETKRHSA